MSMSRFEMIALARATANEKFKKLVFKNNVCETLNSFIYQMKGVNETEALALAVIFESGVIVKGLNGYTFNIPAVSLCLENYECVERRFRKNKKLSFFICEEMM